MMDNLAFTTHNALTQWEFSPFALVVLGASQPGSPFTSKLPGSWIFGIPAAGSTPTPTTSKPPNTQGAHAT